MEDTDFETTLQKLSNQVNQFSGNKNNIVQDKSQPISIPSITGDKKYYYYAGIPIAFLIVLYLWKPSFVLEEVSIEGEMPVKKISFKKTLISSVVLSTIVIIIILFFSIYKPKTS